MHSPIPKLVLIQIIVFTLAMLPFFTRIKYQRGVTRIHGMNAHTMTIAFLGFLFCVIASYDGDWYHYYDLVSSLYHRPDPYTHVEPIYVWIIETLSFGIYIWWRVIVWGGAFWFLWMSFKRFGVNNLFTWSWLMAIGVIQMSTGRVYLGIAMMFYGFSCVIVPRKGIGSIVKGLSIMLVSFVFHKSMIIYIAAALMAIPMYKKWIICFGICLIPVVIKVFTSLLLRYVMSDDVSNAAITYLNDEQMANGPGIMIYRKTLYLLLLISFLLSSKYQMRNCLPKNAFRQIWQMVTILVALYIVVYFALTFQGIGSTSISGRITLGMYFPLAVLMGVMLQRNYKTKLNVSIMIAFYGIGVYRLLYAYYLQSLGVGV